MSAVQPYTGQNQQSQIVVPRRISFQYFDGEEGAWAMLAYSEIFSYSSQGDPTVLQPKPPSGAPYRPTPWIKQIPAKYSPVAPPRIIAKGHPEMMVIEATSVMPPYSGLFPDGQQGGTAFLPPPLAKTDLWSAQQTWPL